MGGRFKSGDFRLLREPLRSRDATVVAIGEATPLIREALDGRRAGCMRPRRCRRPCGARSSWRPKDGTVVLAPACASFDMFRDYAERGRMFKKEVMKLAEEAHGARAVNSRQSACGGRELAAGNAGCPGL